MPFSSVSVAFLYGFFRFFETFSLLHEALLLCMSSLDLHLAKMMSSEWGILNNDRGEMDRWNRTERGMKSKKSEVYIRCVHWAHCVFVNATYNCQFFSLRFLLLHILVVLVRPGECEQIERYFETIKPFCSILKHYLLGHGGFLWFTRWAYQFVCGSKQSKSIM